MEHDKTEAKESIEKCQERGTEIAKEMKEAHDAKDEPRETRLLTELEQIKNEIDSYRGLGGRVRVAPLKEQESA